MLKIDGYDDCIIGVTNCWDGNERVERLIYDGEMLLDAFMDEGVTYAEAIEYIDFNIEGAYVGKDGPMIMWPIEDFEMEELQ